MRRLSPSKRHSPERRELLHDSLLMPALGARNFGWWDHLVFVNRSTWAFYEIAVCGA